MINSEMRKLLLEAFQAGDYRVNSEHPKESATKRFDTWIAEKHPELLEPDTYRHFDIMCECDEFTPYDKSKGCCCYD